MNQRLLAEIGRTQRLEIVNALKRSRGLSVNQLVERMRMSYMGIKQHCLTLQGGRLPRYPAPPAKNGTPADGLSFNQTRARSFPGGQ